ncbi:hypothetical protein BGZ76_002443 [Entomortierella beljakovae]|nr:hypothetical protein BGZ76_002443 [Entomortierella beljakovae]
MTTDQQPQEQRQHFRVISKSEQLSSTDVELKVIDIATHHDNVTEKDVVLWEDILVVFKDALFVQNGSFVLPFMKGDDLRNLDPLRILANKDIVYDVILESPTTTLPVQLVLSTNDDTVIDDTNSEGISLSNLLETNKFTNSSSLIYPQPLQIAKEAIEDKYNEVSKENSPACDPHQVENTNLNNENTTYISVSKEPVGMETSYLDFLDFIEDTLQSGTKVKQEELEPYLKAALEGDSEYQFKIGVTFYFDKVVSQDYSKAMEWYLKAAEQGHAIARYNLGDMYADGEGVAQDYSKAMEWYLKAAEQEDADAQFNIGFMYDEGQGVPQDYSKAMEWYLKAAEQGHVDAQNNIGFMYRHGQGVTRDYSKALEWYLKAVEQGDSSVMEDIAELYRGSALSRFNLGVLLMEGDNVTQDYTRFLKSTEKNHAKAQTSIGILHEDGSGVPQNYSEGMDWYLKAVNQDDPQACNNIGRIYCEVMAKEWYLRAGWYGHIDVRVQLGDSYRGGVVVYRDYSKGMEWYRRASYDNNAESKRRIAEMHKIGYGDTKDDKKALEWYILAANHGDDVAQNYLSRLYSVKNINEIN